MLQLYINGYDGEEKKSKTHCTALHCNINININMSFRTRSLCSTVHCSKVQYSTVQCSSIIVLYCSYVLHVSACICFALLCLPKGATTLVDRWRILTRDLARFVSVMTGHDRSCRAASTTTTNTTTIFLRRLLLEQ